MIFHPTVNTLYMWMGCYFKKNLLSSSFGKQSCPWQNWQNGVHAVMCFEISVGLSQVWVCVQGQEAQHLGSGVHLASRSPLSGSAKLCPGHIAFSVILLVKAGMQMASFHLSHMHAHVHILYTQVHCTKHIVYVHGLWHTCFWKTKPKPCSAHK